MISFNVNHSTFRLNFNKSKTKKWLHKIANSYNFNINYLHYEFVSDTEIFRYNIEYLNHKFFTDIITIPYSSFNTNDSKNTLSADVIISVDSVKTNSILYRCSFSNELVRVMAHGLLHMCGFNDKTKNDQEIMSIEEDKCINLFYLMHV